MARRGLCAKIHTLRGELAPMLVTKYPTAGRDRGSRTGRQRCPFQCSTTSRPRAHGDVQVTPAAQASAGPVATTLVSSARPAPAGTAAATRQPPPAAATAGPGPGARPLSTAATASPAAPVRAVLVRIANLREPYR